MSEWVDFTCGLCRTRLRIREQYAHLKGRCPDCGFRIQPLRSPPPPAVIVQPAVTASNDAGEIPDDISLMPEEEEWPEPALHAEPAAFEGIYSVEGWAPMPGQEVATSPPVDSSSLSAPSRSEEQSRSASSERPEAAVGSKAGLSSHAEAVSSAARSVQGEAEDEIFRLVEDDTVRQVSDVPTAGAGTQPPVTSALPSPVKTERVIDPLFLDEIELPLSSNSSPADPLASVPPADSRSGKVPACTGQEPIVTPYSLSGGMPAPPPLATFAESPTFEDLSQAGTTAGDPGSRPKRKRLANGGSRQDTDVRPGRQAGLGPPPGPSPEVPTHDEEFVQAEIRRLTQPPPPDKVFFAPAIWSFPWHREGIGTWLVTTLGLSLALGLVGSLRDVPDSPLRGFLTCLIAGAAAVVAGLTGLVLAPRYFQIVAATANEANQGETLDLELSDRLASLARFVWLLLLSGLPSLPVLVLGSGWIALALLLVLATWPALVLGSLTDGSFIWPVRARVLSTLKARSNYYISGWFLSVLLWLPSLILIAVFGETWLSALPLALALSTACLIHARLIGRLGWVMNWDEAKALQQRKKKRSASSRRQTEDALAESSSADSRPTIDSPLSESVRKNDLLSDRFT